MIDDLRRLVEVESKTGEINALTTCATQLIELGQRLFAPHGRLRLVETEVGPIVQWRFGPGPHTLALVGHFDTVHPLGSLAATPFVVSGGTARGLGTFDMKAGIVSMLYGLSSVLRTDPAAADGTLVHLCPDEENGSEVSKQFLAEAVLEGLRAALVYEGAGPGGAVYTARKGGLWIEVEFRGHDAHASRAGEGRNALQAMLNFGTLVPALENPSCATTVVVTRAGAGTTMNTAPGHAVLTIDCRTLTDEEQLRVLHELREFPADPTGVTRQLHVRQRVAAMPEAGSRALHAVVDRAAQEAGRAGLGAAVGFGVSDANHLAGLGVAVIDGLGPLGGQDHSPREWIDVDSMRDRAQLSADILPAVRAFSARLESSAGLDLHPGQLINVIAPRE